MDRIYTLAVRAEGIDNNCLGSRPVRRSIARICASADALHLEPSRAGSEKDAPHGSGGRGARYDKQCVVGHVVFTKFCSSSPRRVSRQDPPGIQHVCAVPNMEPGTIAAFRPSSRERTAEKTISCPRLLEIAYRCALFASVH